MHFADDVPHIIVGVGEVLAVLGDAPASSTIKKGPYPEQNSEYDHLKTISIS